MPWIAVGLRVTTATRKLAMVQSRRKEVLMTIVEKKTGEFNAAHVEYVDKKIAARSTRDGSESNRAYEECRNKALALRELLGDQDPENSERVDARIADLDVCHETFLRELRGLKSNRPASL
jgi:hypothetical protein